MLPSLKVTAPKFGTTRGRSNLHRCDRSAQFRVVRLVSNASVVFGFLQLTGLALAQMAPNSTNREPAQPPAALDLKVYRDVSTHGCPDATQLRQALFSHSVSLPRERLVLRIEFSRSEARTVASIGVSGARSGTRILQIPDENCSALTEPVAVALAMLLDSAPPIGGTADGYQPVSGSSNREVTSKRATSVPAASRREPVGVQSDCTPMAATNPCKVTVKAVESKVGADFGAALGAGPSLAFGLIPRVAYGAELQGLLRWQWASMRVQGAKYASDSVDFGGGQLRGQTELVRLALCAERELGRRFHGGACAAAWMRQLTARSSGFTSNGSVATRRWAVGSLVELTYRAYTHLDLYLQAAWLVPTAKDVFSVEGIPGEAFHSTPVAFTLSTGLWLKSL